MASQQVTGNIGMYFAAYRLSRLGWNVMPTTRNARGIDLLIYDAAGKDTLGIQVKALSKEKPQWIETKLEHYFDNAHKGRRTIARVLAIYFLLLFDGPGWGAVTHFVVGPGACGAVTDFVVGPGGWGAVTDFVVGTGA
jgi:hypothetical protein